MTKAEQTLGERLVELEGHWIRRAQRRDTTSVPPIVYHYTDAAGLIGTLASNKLWLTDVRFLNDKTEGIFAKNLMLEYTKENCSGQALDGLFCKRLTDLLQQEHPDESFIYSTSVHKDDLSQWRGYANDGLGFTIGLCGKTLCSLAQNTAPFNFAPVEYDQVKQRAILDEIFQEFRQEIQRFAKKGDQSVRSIVDDVAYSVSYVIENMIAFHKHESFRSEGEWRLVTYVEEEDRQLEVKVRARGSRLVPYSELELGDRLPIVEIGVGPAFTEAGELVAAKRLCEQHGYDATIYAADTPFRRS